MSTFSHGIQEKKKDIWLSPMTEVPVPTENLQKAKRQLKNETKIFDYTLQR